MATSAGRAKRNLKRAQGLIREAIGELAAFEDPIGSLEIRDPAGLTAGRELLEHALEDFGPVRLIVVRAAPARDHQGAQEARREQHQ